MRHLGPAACGATRTGERATGGVGALGSAGLAIFLRREFHRGAPTRQGRAGWWWGWNASAASTGRCLPTLRRWHNARPLPTCLLLSLGLGIVCLAFGKAAAVSLNPGDILVADSSDFGGSAGVIRVDPETGAQTVVSSGGVFVNPAGIAIAANGDLLAADENTFGGPCPVGCGGIVRVDPTTGAQTVVSSGGDFANAFGLAIVPGPAHAVPEPACLLPFSFGLTAFLLVRRGGGHVAG